MINLYKFLLALVCCIFLNFAYGQQRFINNLRLFNDMMSNPAKIMENHGMSIYVSHRQQFWNMRENSPRVTVVGFKTNLKTYYSQNLLYTQKNRGINNNYNYAIGGYYLNSFTGGVFDQNEFCGQFGIQWKFGQTLEDPTYFNQLNFGIAIKGISNQYRGNSIYLHDQIDPVFTSYAVSNQYAITAVPGVQFVSDVIQLDGFYTFGPKDQQFASLSFMGSPKLNGFFSQTALRINYFGNPNLQLGVSKIHDLGNRSSNHIWSLNYGMNVFMGKKFSTNSSVISNPGVFFGICFRNLGTPSKRSANWKNPMRQSVIKGAINLFDANFNTLALGPSAEAALMYNSNTVVCDCDRMYDQFLLPDAQKAENLLMLKDYETNYLRKCNVIAYASSYEKYRGQIRKIITDLEDDFKSNESNNGFEFKTSKIGNQEWHCENLVFTEGLAFVSSQAEWDKLSPKKPCYCYINFDQKNKSYGFLYNSKAFKSISNNSKLRNSGFKVAVKSDWDILFKYAKKEYIVSSLYNCDNRTTSGFNLKNSGYYDQEVWYKPEPEDGQTNYWISEENVYGFQCASKGEIMPDEIDSDFLKERLDKSAFHIRIIKL